MRVCSLTSGKVRALSTVKTLDGTEDQGYNALFWSLIFFVLDHGQDQKLLSLHSDPQASLSNCLLTDWGKSIHLPTRSQSWPLTPKDLAVTHPAFGKAGWV